MTDTVNVPEVFDRQRRRIVRDRACARSTGDDFFSQIMVEEILERLDVVKRTFRRALIIGLPATRLGTELKSRGMKVVFADASARLARSVGGVICDDDRLPFADHSFDLIINIGSLDTINDLPGALVLIRRILLPDGLMLAALIGAESFSSLKSVMMEAEGDRVSAHIHPQIDDSWRPCGSSRTHVAGGRQRSVAPEIFEPSALDCRYKRCGGKQYHDRQPHRYSA